MVLLSWWISATLFQISLCRVLHCPQKLKSIKKTLFRMKWLTCHIHEFIMRMICTGFPSKRLVSWFVQGFLLMPNLHDFSNPSTSVMQTGKIDGNGESWSRDLFFTDLSSTYWMRHRGARPSEPWASAKELNAWNWPRWQRPHQLLGTSCGQGWAWLQTRRYCQDQAASSQKKSKKGGMFNKHPFWNCIFSFDDSKRLLYMKIYSCFTQHPVLNGNDEMVVSGCSCIFQWKK